MNACTGVLKAHCVATTTSMQGHNRDIGLSLGERLWRHGTHEDVCRQWYPTKAEVQRGLRDDSVFNNTERIHQSLNDMTLGEVYGKRVAAEPGL
ncbi:MAG: hypothetical protein ABIU05_12840 [Nitrospirales bacterium]